MTSLLFLAIAEPKACNYAQGSADLGQCIYYLNFTSQNNTSKQGPLNRPMYVYICVCVYVCMCIYIYYIYMHMYMHISGDQYYTGYYRTLLALDVKDSFSMSGMTASVDICRSFPHPSPGTEP